MIPREYEILLPCSIDSGVESGHAEHAILCPIFPENDEK